MDGLGLIVRAIILGRWLAPVLLLGHFNSHSPSPPSVLLPPRPTGCPKLIGCLLVRHQVNGELVGGVIVETEAYCHSEPACHGRRHRTPSNETLFGELGRFDVFVSDDIRPCVKRAVALRRSGWA